VLDQAGLTAARKQYRLLNDRNYPGIILGGGARGTQHFTGLVGGAVHITINWSTAAEILEMDPAIENEMETQTDQSVIDELLDKLPDFRRAYLEDGLELEEYAGYGPVQHFRNQFIGGWDSLLETIRERRTAVGAGGRA